MPAAAACSVLSHVVVVMFTHGRPSLLFQVVAVPCVRGLGLGCGLVLLLLLLLCCVCMCEWLWLDGEHETKHRRTCCEEMRTYHYTSVNGSQAIYTTLHHTCCGPQRPLRGHRLNRKEPRSTTPRETTTFSDDGSHGDPWRVQILRKEHIEIVLCVDHHRAVSRAHHDHQGLVRCTPRWHHHGLSRFPHQSQGRQHAAMSTRLQGLGGSNATTIPHTHPSFDGCKQGGQRKERLASGACA